MSKIGRKPIDISKVTLTTNSKWLMLKGARVHFLITLPMVSDTIDEAAKTMTLGITKTLVKIVLHGERIVRFLQIKCMALV